MRNAISNTSCLIALTNIDKLEILQKRYGHIVITPEVGAYLKTQPGFLDKHRIWGAFAGLDFGCSGKRRLQNVFDCQIS
jgi:hypothetical protein